MHCFKCGKELNEGVKFCKFCGQNQRDKSANIKNNNSMNQRLSTGSENLNKVASVGSEHLKKLVVVGAYAYGRGVTLIKGLLDKVPTVTGDNLSEILSKLNRTLKQGVQKLTNSKYKYAIIGGCIVLCASTAFAANVILNTPKAVVGRAILKTISTMEKEAGDILEEIPAITYFEDLEKNQYSFSTEIAGVQTTLYTDFKNKQIKSVIEYMGIETTGYMSESILTFESNLLENQYGFNFETLSDDIENCEYLNVSFPEDYDINYFEIDEEFVKEYTKILENCSKEIFDIIEVEKIENEEIIIDGKKKEVPTYSVVLDANDLEDVLIAMVDEIFENDKIISKYENELAANNAFFMILSEYEHIDEKLYTADLDDIRNMYETAIDNFIKYYEYLEDTEIKISINEGKVAQIILGDEYNNNIITLNSTGNILDEIVLQSPSDKLTFSAKLEDDIFEVKFESSDSRYTSMKYDVLGSRNNLTFTSPSGDTVVCTLNATNKNNLIFEYSEYIIFLGTIEVYIELEKGNFDKNWFNQDDDFINIFLLDADDFTDINAEMVSNYYGY